MFLKKLPAGYHFDQPQAAERNLSNAHLKIPHPAKAVFVMTGVVATWFEIRNIVQSSLFS